jgi:antirestriction protein ArdC
MTRSVLTAEKFQIGAGLSGYVAELGSCFLCADLGIAPELEPRADHASYLASWLKVLADDKRAIFSAAAHAQRAVAFLHGLQPAASDGREAA